MINEKTISNWAEECLNNGSVFVVSVTIRKGNRILVLLDGDSGVSIDECSRVSRFIESHLDREQEDFELEVSSFGIGTPLIMPRQYVLNIGRTARVTLNDGTVLSGVIVHADEHSFGLEVKIPPKKKETEIKTFSYPDCQKTQITVSFK